MWNSLARPAKTKHETRPKILITADRTQKANGRNNIQSQSNHARAARATEMQSFKYFVCREGHI